MTEELVLIVVEATALGVVSILAVVNTEEAVVVVLALVELEIVTPMELVFLVACVALGIITLVVAVVVLQSPPRVAVMVCGRECVAVALGLVIVIGRVCVCDLGFTVCHLLTMSDGNRAVGVTRGVSPTGKTSDSLSKASGLTWEKGKQRPSLRELQGAGDTCSTSRGTEKTQVAAAVKNKMNECIV